MSTSVNLSIIILTHRADQLFERALASAQFAAEVMVVDNSEGTDWKTLGKHYQFTVIPHPAELTDWSAVRNEALAAAHHEWVFFLDSDEVITPQSVPLIASIISHNIFHGVLVKRHDVFYSKQLRYGEAGNQTLIRLGRKQNMKFARPVHEEAHISGLVSTSEITLLHYSHPSINEFLDSVAQYARREAAYRSQNHRPLFLPSMVIFPTGKFLLNYFFKLGFLDGWQGFIYAFMMSLHSLFVRVNQYESALPTHETIL